MEAERDQRWADIRFLRNIARKEKRDRAMTTKDMGAILLMSLALVLFGSMFWFTMEITSGKITALVGEVFYLLV